MRLRRSLQWNFTKRQDALSEDGVEMGSRDGVSLVLGLRLAAIRWKLSLPLFQVNRAGKMRKPKTRRLSAMLIPPDREGQCFGKQLFPCFPKSFPWRTSRLERPTGAGGSFPKTVTLFSGSCLTQQSGSSPSSGENASGKTPGPGPLNPDSGPGPPVPGSGPCSGCGRGP
ncbi:hypothetical protein SAMN06295888_11068 [Desulfonatronum zhilinae]|nr:hypothetical protein SAMN06295888_11068 [Desulfonatronum zhilinae]